MPITDDLSEIFDIGSEIHESEEFYRAGARGIIESELYRRIIHQSGKYAIGGKLDFYMAFILGKYIEDLKSTKKGGFFYFLKEGVNDDNKLQISIYAYIKYIHTSIITKIGVITKIDKEDPLNKISLSTSLYTIEDVRKFLEQHPVILCTLGDITVEQLIESTANKIRPEVNKKTGEYWKCTNCQYNTANGITKELCPVRQQI